MSLVSVGWRRHSTWQAFEERVVTRAPSLRQYTNEDNDEEEDELQDSAGRLHAQKVSELPRVGAVGLLRNLPVTSATGSAAATAVAA